jgi:hypothetical protein
MGPARPALSTAAQNRHARVSERTPVDESGKRLLFNFGLALGILPSRSPDMRGASQARCRKSACAHFREYSCRRVQKPPTDSIWAGAGHSAWSKSGMGGAGEARAENGPPIAGASTFSRVLL